MESIGLLEKKENEQRKRQKEIPYLIGVFERDEKKKGPPESEALGRLLRHLDYGIDY